MNDVNRSSVIVNLTDARGQLIRDEVELTFYNQRAQSLNQRFAVQFSGAPVTLTDVPAFPFGNAEVFIKPDKYRYKSIFVNVPAGAPGRVEETFFVDPDVVTPVFPDFAAVQTQPRWAELWRVLQNSGIAGLTGWGLLTDQQKAGLFNLYTKMQAEVINGAKTVFSYLVRTTKFLPARIFADVPAGLREDVSNLPEKFHPVPGVLHEFPEGWTLDSSFKTWDRAGNLQLTFARNATNAYRADIDIDDHQGIEHAADVLKHTITGKDTNPYDIHEILIYFQHLDPGYLLI